MERTNSSTNLIDDLTIQKIWELAADIGNQFKKLLDQHGPELNQSLIPTVVRVLEYLEEAVMQREDYMLLVDKLHRQIEDLQRGQHEQTLQRTQQMKYLEQEIADIDDSWRKENIQLSHCVKYLRSENKRLASSLSEKFSQSLTDLKHDEAEEDKVTQNDLDKLTKRISLLCKEIKLKADEIDNLKSQNDNFLEENQNLRNLMITIRNNSTRANTKEVQQVADNTNKVNDKTCLEEKIRSLEEEIEMYKMRLKMTETKPEPLIDSTLINDRNNNSDATEKVEVAEEPEECIQMEDSWNLPVQGPIPKEPDEKLFFRERKSRIWSFFPRLTRALIK